MSRENSFQNTVLKQFRKRGLHCVKHNDSFTPGIPDLSVYHPLLRRTQWIELKVIRAWPKWSTTFVDFGFETEQSYFLLKRNGYGLVKVEKEVLLLPAFACYNNIIKSNLLKVVDYRAQDGRVDWDVLLWKLYQ